MLNQVRSILQQLNLNQLHQLAREFEQPLQSISSTLGHTSTVFPKRTIIPVCTGKEKESRSCLCFV